MEWEIVGKLFLHISNTNVTVLIHFHFNNIDFDGEAVFRLNSRNAMNLVYNGHSFYKHRATKNGADYWMCHKRTDKQYRCRARVYSMKVDTKYMVKVINDLHTHEPAIE